MSVHEPKKKLMTLRIAPDEKSRLETLAKKRNVTLSHALREGAKLFLHDDSKDEISDQRYEQTEIVLAQ